MTKTTIGNSARGHDCGEEIESVTRHSFVSCKCGHLAVDGGKAYLRRVFKEHGRWVDTSIEEELP